MLDELIKAGKINKEDAQVYYLFKSELGHEWLMREKHILFMEQPIPSEISADKILYIDGRRSYLRDLINLLSHIEHLIAEAQNG